SRPAVSRDPVSRNPGLFLDSRAAPFGRWVLVRTGMTATDASHSGSIVAAAAMGLDATGCGTTTCDDEARWYALTAALAAAAPALSTCAAGRVRVRLWWVAMLTSSVAMTSATVLAPIPSHP